MSVIRPRPPEDPIAYDAGTLSAMPPETLLAVHAALARGGLAGDERHAAGLPDRLLADYNTGGGRAASAVFAILRAARRLGERVDRVIVLGDARELLAARGVFESCGHPFHNELSRGERGGRPRLSFLVPPVEGDVLAGLLDLVAPAGRPRSGDLLDQWGLVVVGRHEAAPEAAAVAGLLVEALCAHVGGDRGEAGRRTAVIAGPGHWPCAVRAALGSDDPAGVDPARGGGFSLPGAGNAGAAVWTAIGLLPAAIAGIDVVRLLQGAAAMNRRFRETPAGEHPVFRHVGAWGGLGGLRPPRSFISPSGQLDAICRWQSPPAAVASRPATALVVGETRRDPLATGRTTDRPPAAADSLWLPRVDEHTVGQLLQFLVLANLVEAAVDEAAGGAASAAGEAI